MNIFPAIDLIGGKAVRLKKGDYNQKTVYNENPLTVANSFKKCGAQFLHLVDLDGAKSGLTDNFSTIKDIIENSGLSVEVGGGIRDEAVVEKYIKIGASRVIIGTAAVTNREFLKTVVKRFGEKIAVGVDIKDGFVALKGWTAVSNDTCLDFCLDMQKLGVKTVIVTDISKDGMLCGTNIGLYKNLSQSLDIDVVASGGVTSLEDVKKLKEIGLSGAILGKALYTGNIKLEQAIQVSGEERL